MKVIKKTYRALSVLLVAALVATSTPDVCLTTYAAEGEEVTAEETVSDEAIEVVAEDDAEPAEEDVQDQDDADEELPAGDTESNDTPAEVVSDTTDQDTNDSNTAGEEDVAADEPVADEPAADEPVADEPAAEEPVAEEPVAEPVETPVVEEPVADDEIVAQEDPVAAVITVVEEKENATVEYTANVADGKIEDKAVDTTFTVTAADKYVVTSVKYKVDNGEAKTLTAPYTIPANTISDEDSHTVTIIVETAKKPLVKVVADSQKFEVDSAFVDGKYFEENAEVALTITAKEGYQLGEVTYQVSGDAKIYDVANAGNTYTIAADTIKNGKEYTITVNADTKSVVTFEDKDDDHYTITPEDPVDYSDGYGFTVAVDAGYSCKSIVVKDKNGTVVENYGKVVDTLHTIPTSYFTPGESYTVEVVVAEQLALTVNTDNAGISNPGYFVGRGTSSSVAPTTVDKGDTLYVQVTEAENKKVSVTYKATEDAADETIKATEAELVTSNDNAYLYKIVMEEATTVYVVEEDDIQKLDLTIDRDYDYTTVEYYDNSTSQYVKVPLDQRVLSVRDGIINKNGQVTIRVTASDKKSDVVNYERGIVSVKLDDKELETAAPTGSIVATEQYTFTMTKDATLHINTSEAFDISVPANANVSSVAYGFTASAVTGVTNVSLISGGTGFYYDRGTVYIKVTPVGGKVVKTVKLGETALAYDADNNVYYGTVDADATLTVETENAAAAQGLNFDYTSGDVTIKWSSDKYNKNFTLVSGSGVILNPTATPVYFMVDVVDDSTTVLDGVFVGETELKAEGTLYSVEELTTVTVKTHHKSNSLTFDFTNTSATEITYKVEGAEAPATANSVTGAISVEYDKDVTITAPENAQLVVDNKVCELADNREYVLNMTKATTVKIESIIDVEFTGDGLTTEGAKLMYSTVQNGTYTEVSKNADSKYAVKVPAGTTVYYIVTAKGYRTASSSEAIETTPDSQKITIAALTKGTTVNFNVKGATGLGVTVDYQLVAKDTAKTEAFVSAGTVSSVPVTTPDNTWLYFNNITLTGSNHELYRVVDVEGADSDEVGPTDAKVKVYKVSDLTDNVTVTVTVEPLKVGGVTFVNGKTSANLKVKVADKEVAFDTPVNVKAEDSSIAFELTGLTQEVGAEDNKTTEVVEIVRAISHTYLDARGRSHSKTIDLTSDNKYEVSFVEGSTNHVITIDSVALKDVNVTFTENKYSTDSAITEIKAGLSEKASDNATATIGTPLSVASAETKTLNVQVTMVDGYKLENATVTIGTSATTVDVEENDKVYTFEVAMPTNLTISSDLSVAVELKTRLIFDETKYAKVDFSNAGERVSVVVPPAGTLFEKTDEADVYITNAESLTYTVKAKLGYKITGMTVDNKEYDFSDDELNAVNNVNGSGQAFILEELWKKEGEVTTYYNKAVTFTTETLAIDHNGNASFSLNPNDDDILAIVFENDNTEYSGDISRAIPEGTSTFRFDVIVKGAYELANLYTNGLKGFEIPAPVVSGDKKIYSFEFAAAQLDDYGTIYVSAVEETKDVSVVYEKAFVKEITVNGDFADEIKSNGEEKTAIFEVPVGTPAKILVKVPAYLSVTTDGFTYEGYDQTDNTAIYKKYIESVSEDTIIEVETVEDYVVHLSYAGEGSLSERRVIPNAKGQYPVMNNIAYEVTGTAGNAAMTFTAASFGNYADAAVVAEDGKSVSLVIPAAAAGKTVKFTVSYQLGEETASRVYTLVVDKKLSKLTIKEAKNNEVTQSIYTQKAYTVALSGSTNYDRVYAVVAEDEAGVIAKYEDMQQAWVDTFEKKLYVTTTGVEGSAKINFYVAGEVDETGEADRVVATLTVNTVMPELNLKSVKLNKAFHDGFTFTVTTDGKAANYYVGANLQYQTTVTAPAETVFDLTKDNVFEIGASNLKSQAMTINFTQKAKTQLSETGEAFKLSTKLVLVNDKGETIAESNAVENDFTTVGAYYEDNFSLTKKTTTVYTGQSGITVAVPKFSKNATYDDMTADVTIYNAAGELVTNGDISAWWAGDNTIRLSVADEYNLAGKYTIKVAPYANVNETQMYAKPASIAVTVVQGIKNISLSPDNTNIYYNNKAVTYKVTPTYNDGYASRKPKTAKVDWYVIKEGTYDYRYDAGNFYVKGTPVTGVTITTSGQIKINNKLFKLSDDPADNRIEVIAVPRDYAGNDNIGRATYTICNEATTFGNVYLANYSEDTGVYNVISGDKFTTDQIYGAEIIVTKNGVAADRPYYEEDDLVSESEYTLKISNKKMAINSVGDLYPNNTIAKNVKITATSNDGGKKTATMTFTTVYNTASTMSIEAHDYDGFVGMNPEDGVYHFQSNTADDILEIYVLADGNRLDAKATYNYSLTGGKILTSSNNQGWFRILPTAAKTTVKLQDKNSKKTYTYIFQNDTVAKGKALSVSLEKKTLYAGWNQVQTIKLTIPKQTNTSYGYAYIGYDATDYAKKGYSYYNGINNGGTEIVSLNRYDSNEVIIEIPRNMQAGSYKFNITFGTRDGNTEASFVPQSVKKAFTINIKKAQTFKATGSYTLDPSVGFVTLSGKPAEQIDFAFDNAQIKNANIKGQPNSFVEYFKVVDGKLVLRNKIDPTTEKETKELWTADELAAIIKADKNAFTGYVSYVDAKTGNTEWAQIKVNVKVAKYTAKDIATYAGETGATGTTYITKGWSDVNVSAVYAESDTIEFKYDTKNEYNGTCALGGKYVQLVTASVPEAGKHKVTLYVIDSSSVAAAGLSSATDKNAYIKTYGAPVSLNFTVLKDAKNKIKFAKNANKFTFSEYDYEATTETWTRDVWVYDKLDGVEISGFALDENAPEYITAAQYVTENENNKYYYDAVVFTIDKAKYAEAVAADQKILGSKINVNLVASYKNGLADDTYKFTITTPATIQTYAEALEAVKANGMAALTAAPIGNTDTYDNVEIIKSVLEGAYGLTHRESGLRAEVAQVAYQEATKNAFGWYIATVKVYNANKSATEEEAKGYTFQQIRWEIPAINPTQTIGQAEAAVTSALNSYFASNPANDNTSKDAVLKVAQNAVTNPNIDVRIKNWSLRKAAENVNGSLNFEVVLSRSIWNRTTLDVSRTWSAIDSFDEACVKIKNLLENGSPALNKITDAETAEDLILAAAKAATNKTDITVVEFGTSDAEKFQSFVAPTTGKDGSFAGTLYVRTAGRGYKKLVITGVIPMMDTVAKLDEKVNAAIERTVLSNGQSADTLVKIAESVNYNSEYEISYKENTDAEKENYVVKDATKTGTGSVKITFMYTPAGENATPVAGTTRTYVINKLGTGILEAKSDAQSAVNAMTVTASTSQSDVEKAIADTIDSTYTATISNFKKDAENSKITATVTITLAKNDYYASADKDEVVFDITLTIPAADAAN